MADDSEKTKETSPETKTAEETGDKKKTEKAKHEGPPLKIFYHWCKGCNICIAFCPQKVFEPDRDGKPIIAHPEECTQCAFCWLHCPDMAIVSTEK